MPRAGGAAQLTIVYDEAAEFGSLARGARPYFLPLTLWFAYLLRDDVRAYRPIEEPEALKDFCCWWLIIGRTEYPAVWGVTQAVVDVAMRTIRTPGGEMPRLLWYLWQTQPNLQGAFKLLGFEQRCEYLCWYRLVAPTQLDYAPPLPERYLMLTEQVPSYLTSGAGLPRIALMMAMLSPQLSKSVDLRTPQGQQQLARFYAQNGKRLIPQPKHFPHPPAEPRQTLEMFPGGAIGINLVGFARSEFGLGEDVRMASRVLEAAGIPHGVVDMAADTASVARRADDSLAARLIEAPTHPMTMLCMSPFDAATLWLKRGHAIFDERYIVGYFVWELERLPAAWHEVALLVDEIWAPSQFAAASFRAQEFRPVRYLPPLVELPAVPKLSRKQLGLPARKFLFICPFDPNSFITRKNPDGVVHAFRRAFPIDSADADRVRLLLRVNGATEGPGWTKVQQAVADDPRVVVIEGTMERGRALAMLAASDCLVSLHRSEGFGRNIAEAKLLGVKVIATGYSGCLDFLEPEECVGFDRTPVGADYPYGAGLCWAEPDLEDAAAKMRAAASRQGRAKRR